MTRSLSALERILRRCNRLFAVSSGIALLAMMLVGAIDVAGTSLFNQPLPGTFEATETLMVVTIFLALGLSQQRRTHISVEVVVKCMPAWMQRLSGLLAAGLSLLFFALIAWFGWEAAARSYAVGEFSSGIVNFPIWPAKGALALGASLMAAQCLWDMGVAVVRGPADIDGLGAVEAD